MAVKSSVYLYRDAIERGCGGEVKLKIDRKKGNLIAVNQTEISLSSETTRTSVLLCCE